MIKAVTNAVEGCFIASLTALREFPIAWLVSISVPVAWTPGGALVSPNGFLGVQEFSAVVIASAMEAGVLSWAEILSTFDVLASPLDTDAV